ncbi:MAG TPA: NAD-dependent dehydratase, partial [Arenimonas sp.]|nr:NAD-dependent dehydratase [Arenimonas sp.]
AFRTVDHDYVLSAAKQAVAAGCRTFVLNSSLGADASSGNFYLKVKGDIEQALVKLEFKSLTFIRPSLLNGGPRPERRYGEEIGLWLGKRLNALIPRRYRPVSTKNVAKAMLEAALRPKSGLHIVESEALDHSMGKL